MIFDIKLSHSEILARHGEGIEEEDWASLAKRYGECQLTIPRKSIPRLLVDEVLNPFYIFQVFSMILWFVDDYTKYACCILVISLAGIVENLYETVSNINSIRRMAKYECDLQVKRRVNGKTQLTPTSSHNLVPGDILIVPENCLMPCDVVLLTGSCIVNESMLTGESVPVIKNALLPTNQLYNPQVYDSIKKYTLFSGTKIIQTRGVGD